MTHNKLDITKPMQTRDGICKLELVADLRHIEGLDRDEVLVMRLIRPDSTSEICTYYADGKTYERVEHELDVVNALATHTRWVVWYRVAPYHSTGKGKCVRAFTRIHKPDFEVGYVDRDGDTVLRIQEITYTEPSEKEDELL